MGLFSGGGFYGKVGEALGINTDRAQAAARQAGEQDIAGQKRAIGELKDAFGIAREELTGATGLAQDTIRGGNANGCIVIGNCEHINTTCPGFFD